MPRQSEKNVQISLLSYIGITNLTMSIGVLVLANHFICHVVMEKTGCRSIAVVIAMIASPAAMTSMLSLIKQVVVHRAHVTTCSSSSSEQHLLDWTDCRHLVVILDRELRWYRR